MIRAIIFDCFGVLTTDGWLPFKKRYFAAHPELDQQATDLSKQVNAGMLEYREFILQIAEMAGVSQVEASNAMHQNAPNEELFEFMQSELKPAYKIGMLSNAGRNMVEELFSSDQQALFDEFALSYKTGFLKPDAAAYGTIADRLGVRPEDCVFIDDQPGYCAAARQTGMQAIAYEDFDQMRADLREILAKQA